MGALFHVGLLLQAWVDKTDEGSEDDNPIHGLERMVSSIFRIRRRRGPPVGTLFPAVRGC